MMEILEMFTQQGFHTMTASRGPKGKLFLNLGQKLEQTCFMVTRLCGHEDSLCQIDQEDSSKG